MILVVSLLLMLIGGWYAAGPAGVVVTLVLVLIELVQGTADENRELAVSTPPRASRAAAGVSDDPQVVLAR